VQRLLWASTGTKNPAYRDTRYVEALIGADTVDTLPRATLEAFRDHGAALTTLDKGVPEARQRLAAFAALGFDLGVLTQQLEDEGVEKFKQPFGKLLETLTQRAAQAASARPLVQR
jgi:transaldolase/transaldolase/glucose-6-phosphate isomerase